MRDDTLLWHPAQQSLERTRFTDRLAVEPSALALHRTRGPNAGLGIACAAVGVELLPAFLRAAHHSGACLLWLPLVPSRCMRIARSPLGFMQVVHRPTGDEALARVLEELEVACAWAFDEASVPEAAHIDLGRYGELACHLQSALGLTIDALGRFAARERAQGASA